jgi:hypothetical protein
MSADATRTNYELALLYKVYIRVAWFFSVQQIKMGKISQMYQMALKYTIWQ